MRFKCKAQSVLVLAAATLAAACGDSSGPGNPPAKVVVVAGDAQPSAVVGTKLAAPLIIRVTDSQGEGVRGATVTWTATAGTLSAPTSLTDRSGQASIEWTLGIFAGNQIVTATVKGIDPVTFTHRAIPGPLTQIIVSRDTVRLLGTGDTFRFSARPADQFGNFVIGGAVVESADTSVVTAINFGTGANLIARKPDALTTLRATAGGLTRTATVIVLPPPCTTGVNAVTLAVGEVAVFAGADAAEFCVKGSADGAEFTAIPFYSDLSSSLLRLEFFSGGTTLGVSPNMVTAPRFAAVAKPQPLVRDDAFEVRLRALSERELAPLIPAARAAAAHGLSPRLSISVRTPEVGDLLQLNTNALSSCGNPNMRTGRIAAISTRAIIVADTGNPVNGFTDADYQNFGTMFDTLVYSVDTQNFGEPTDIDGNQRVILFYTRAVNELTPPGQNFYVGGFFFNRDLFPKTGAVAPGNCATSNVAEMFYLLVPDPEGVVNQNVRTADFVRRSTIGTLAHELQHLINSSRHLYINTKNEQFEEIFLDEGLAHEAEELVFYKASGLAPRQNISVATIQSSQRISDAFDMFGEGNIRRLREYLENPQISSPYAENANLTTRGAIWSFLRYAADRRGGTESQMWFLLANSTVTTERGFANIQRVIGPDLVSWIRDWATANYTDDFVSNVALAHTHQSWNFREVVPYADGRTFPLETQQMESATLTSVGIGDGSAAYLRFGVGSGVVGGGRLTARAGVPPAGFFLSLLRTK